MTTARELLAHRELHVLIALAALVRLVALPWIGPHVLPDSEAYLRLAERLVALDLTGDDGTRTPVYPLLLALLGRSGWALLAVQGALGVAGAALLYAIGHGATGSRRAALAMALVPTLDPGALLFEAALLTEALTSFLVVAAVAAAARAARDDDGGGALLVAGLAAALAGLTRPAFQLLPLLLVGTVTLLRRRDGRPLPAPGRAVAALVPWAALILGWSAFNRARFGWFTLTTLLGLNLAQHAAGFAELASPEHHLLADPLVAGRLAKGSPIGAIWKALPELEAATGLDVPGVSRLLVGMSVDLFGHHPLRYGASVAKAAVLFWFPAPYHQGFSLGAYFRLGEPAVVYAYSAAYLIVVAAAGLGAVAALVRRRARAASPEAVLALVTVASTWAITSATEIGENARYKLPVQALVLAWGTLALGGRRTAR